MVRMYNNINSTFRGLTTKAIMSVTSLGYKAVEYIQNLPVFNHPNIVMANTIDTIGTACASMNDNIKHSAEFINQYANIAHDVTNDLLVNAQNVMNVIKDDAQDAQNTIANNWYLVDDYVDNTNQMIWDATENAIEATTDTVNQMIHDFTNIAVSTVETTADIYKDVFNNYHASSELDQPYSTVSDDDWDVITLQDFWGVDN